MHTVVVTHSHPDHFGGAGLLRTRAGAEVVTHRSFRTWLDPDEGDEGALDDGDGTDDDGGKAKSPWKREQPWSGDAVPAAAAPALRHAGGPVARPAVDAGPRAQSPGRRRATC